MMSALLETTPVITYVTIFLGLMNVCVILDMNYRMTAILVLVRKQNIK